MLTYACYPTPFLLKLGNQLELGLRDWNFLPYPTHPKFLCGAYSLLACCGALRPFPPKLCGMGSLSFHAGFPPIYMGACGALWTHVCLSLGRFRPLKSFHAARSCLESSLFGVGGGRHGVCGSSVCSLCLNCSGKAGRASVRFPSPVA